MFTLLVVLTIITATLLILTTAVQSSKKEGLGSSWGSANASQLIGIKQTSDLLEQVTWGLIITLFALSIATSVFLKREHARNLPSSPNLNNIQDRVLLPEPKQEDTTHPEERNTADSVE